jgi:hypothetical protein
MWKCGTASTVITPKEPLWLAGYAARTRPSQGTISDLRATALVLEDDAGGRLAIVSVDLIAITQAIATHAYAGIENALGLPRERVILAASHTHFGPEFRPDKVLFFKVPPEYAAKVPPVGKLMGEAIARVAAEAANGLKPARLVARRASAGFAHNRRRAGVRDGAPSTEDTLDHDVPVLNVLDAATGRRAAILFGYACHNTTIDPQDGRYCADWAGFAREELEQRNPGAAALFVAGCGADQNPEPRGTVELSRQYGHELAAAVQGALDAAATGTEITGTIRCARADVPLSMRPLTRESLNAMLARTDDPPQQVKAKFLLDQLDRGEPLLTEYPAATQVVRLGDQFLLIVLSGEPVVDWAAKFKREFAAVAPHVWVAGYCNDMFGYVPTRRIQQEGGYEGGRANLWSWLPSPWTDDVEDRLTAAVRQLVARVS